MGRFERSLQLFKSSWAVIRSEPSFLVLPVLSALGTVVVAVTFLIPAFFTLDTSTTVDAYGYATESTSPTALTFVLMFGFYLASAFVVIFCNAALIAGANQKFEGGDPTLGSALQQAWGHVGAIFRWSLVSATVSMIIRQIQERGGLFGRIVGAIVGVAWSVVTFLVLPMLVIEGVGVREALSRSTAAVKRTWGENLIGQGGIGILGFLLMLPVVGIGALGASLLSSSSVLGVPLIVVAILVGLAVTTVLSAMGVIYQAALYRFAEGLDVASYPTAALESAFEPKRSRGRFA